MVRLLGCEDMANAIDWQQIVAQVQQREPKAERELVDLLLPQVYARITRLLPRRSEAEDLAQEVFAKVFSKIDRYRGGVFPAWVDVITKRVCYDALRKQRARPEWRFSDLPDDPAEAVDQTPVINQKDFDAPRILEQLFSMLPPEQGYLLEQIELRERSIGEVSKELGWTATAGRLRLFRARRALERSYQKWINEKGTPLPSRTD